MNIKQRTEALLLAANRALTVKDISELLEVESAEDESKVLNAITSLREEYEIGTKFSASVKVCQKTFPDTGLANGKPYLVVDKNSITLLDE